MQAKYIIALALFLVVGANVCMPSPRVTLLVLHSLSPDSMTQTPFDELTQPALEKKLGYPIERYFEYLHLERYSEQTDRQKTAELRARYTQQKIDIIVSVGSPALDFMRRHRSELLPGTPLVFVAVELRRLRGFALPSDTTGVVHSDNWGAALGEILRIQPKTRQVVVVAGSAPFDHEYLALQKEQFQPYASKVQFRFLTDLPLLDILAILNRLPANTIVVQSSFNWDSRGQSLTDDGALRMIYAAANAPVYALVGRNLGQGFVGGPIPALRERYLLAANLIYRVLQGEKAASIPVQAALPQHAMGYDWRQLRRWGISDDRLAPDSLIEFKPPPVWNQYKWIIVAISIALVLESLLIFALWVQHGRQKRIAAALVRSQHAIRDLAGRVVAAQENERKRIARELHDDLNQQIAVIGISVSVLKRQISQVARCGNFEELQNKIRVLAATVRQLACETHPHALERLGIGPALAQHVEAFSRRTDIRVHLSSNTDGHPIHPDIALCLFRVAQEGLRNIEKHSGADEAWLRLDYTAGSFYLEIEDNGKGFEVDKSWGPTSLGLTSMEERVRLLNGVFCISSTLGKGTLIEIRVSDPFSNKSIEDADMALSEQYKRF